MICPLAEIDVYLEPYFLEGAGNPAIKLGALSLILFPAYFSLIALSEKALFLFEVVRTVEFKVIETDPAGSCIVTQDTDTHWG